MSNCVVVGRNMPPKFDPRSYTPEHLPKIKEELLDMLESVNKQIHVNQILSDIKENGYHLELSYYDIQHGFSENEFYSQALNSVFPNGWEEMELYYNVTLSSNDKVECRGIDIDYMPYSQEDWVETFGFEPLSQLGPPAKHRVKEQTDGQEWKNGDDWDSPNTLETTVVVWLIFPKRTTVPGTKFKVISQDGTIIKLETKEGKLYYQKTDEIASWDKSWVIFPYKD